MNVKRSKSVLKRRRQAVLAAGVNRSTKSEIKTCIKKVNSDLAAGDVEKAKKDMRVLFSKLDKAVKQGTIHRNKSANHKSQVMKSLAAAGKAKPAARENKS